MPFGFHLHPHCTTISIGSRKKLQIEELCQTPTLSETEERDGGERRRIETEERDGEERRRRETEKRDGEERRRRETEKRSRKCKRALEHTEN